jgi:hypothetical protein
LFKLQELRLLETADQFVDMKRRAMNDRLMLAEKGFLDGDGLKGKQWFKHLVSVFILYLPCFVETLICYIFQVRKAFREMLKYIMQRVKLIVLLHLPKLIHGFLIC